MCEVAHEQGRLGAFGAQEEGPPRGREEGGGQRLLILCREGGVHVEEDAEALAQADGALREWVTAKHQQLCQNLCRTLYKPQVTLLRGRYETLLLACTP